MIGETGERKSAVATPDGKSRKKKKDICLRQVDSCLHCKFRNGAWRPRAAFQDSECPNEDRIIDIDYKILLKGYSRPICLYCIWNSLLKLLKPVSFSL